MTTVTDAFDLFDKWVRDGCEYHPLLISELQSAFAEARAEVERLRAEVSRLRTAAGERDALREALETEVANARDRQWFAEGRLEDIRSDNARLERIEIELRAALAAVPAPQPSPADDRLAWATAGAKEMQITIADGPCWSDEDRPYILELDPVEVARRAVEREAEDKEDIA